jgi:hypothetical protein
LSPDGYFQRLTQAALPKRVLTDAEIDRACRVPPPDSPATVRGRYVRELADRSDARANWQTVTLGHPTPNWTVDLTRCPRGEEAQARSELGSTCGDGSLTSRPPSPS